MAYSVRRFHRLVDDTFYIQIVAADAPDTWGPDLLPATTGHERRIFQTVGGAEIAARCLQQEKQRQTGERYTIFS